jgi:hypothetical protein
MHSGAKISGEDAGSGVFAGEEVSAYISNRIVMAGLVPAIHVLDAARKTWMPGTRPGMTG